MSKNVQKIGTNLSKTCEPKNTKTGLVVFLFMYSTLASVAAPLVILRRPLSGTRARRRAIARKPRLKQTPYGEVLFVCLIIGLSTAILSLQSCSTRCVTGASGFEYLWFIEWVWDLYLVRQQPLWSQLHRNGASTLYYDQISSLYNHWTVISSKITATIVRASNPVQLQAVLVCDDDATLGTSNNINLLIERSDSSTGACDPGNGLLMTLSQTFSAKKWFEPTLANDNLQGTVGGAPTEQVYYALMVQDITGTSQSVAIHVMMEFNVVWDELTSVASS